MNKFLHSNRVFGSDKQCCSSFNCWTFLQSTLRYNQRGMIMWMRIPQGKQNLGGCDPEIRTKTYIERVNNEQLRVLHLDLSFEKKMIVNTLHTLGHA